MKKVGIMNFFFESQEKKPKQKENRANNKVSGNIEKGFRKMKKGNKIEQIIKFLHVIMEKDEQSVKKKMKKERKYNK